MLRFPQTAPDVGFCFSLACLGELVETKPTGVRLQGVDLGGVPTRCGASECSSRRRTGGVPSRRRARERNPWRALCRDLNILKIMNITRKRTLPHDTVDHEVPEMKMTASVARRILVAPILSSLLHTLCKRGNLPVLVVSLSDAQH